MLMMADEKQVYALSDRATYASMRKKISLEVLVEGDPALKNPYGAILTNPAKHTGLHTAGAKAILDYLTSPEGQDLIAGFKANGAQLFFPTAK